MKKTLVYLIFAGLALSSAVSAHAATNQAAEVLSVSKAGPEEMPYNSPTDAAGARGDKSV